MEYFLPGSRVDRLRFSVRPLDFSHCILQSPVSVAARTRLSSSPMFTVAPRRRHSSTANLDFEFDTRAKSQELRLTSPRNDRFEWLIGAAYFDEDRPLTVLWQAPGFNQAVSHDSSQWTDSRGSVGLRVGSGSCQQKLLRVRRTLP